MTTIQPGDVVIALFPGALSTKPRPCVVISTDAYNSTRQDVALALLTTKIQRARPLFDYLLQDWAAAGLHHPSLLSMYLGMAAQGDVTLVGHLSDRDWQEVQARLRLALAVT